MAISSQRLQTLLAFLALHHTEPQPRQRLAFLLWPDSSESQAFTNLRTLLHRMHDTFPDLNHLIRIDPQALSWQAGVTIDLDVADFERAVLEANTTTQAENDAATCLALEYAAARYGGDLLPDCYDEWVLSERERLRQVFLTALERLVALLEERRAYTAATTHARRLVHLDPLNEAAYLDLMRLHALSGDRASALRVYHTCVSMLQAEWGTVPGAALSMAYEHLLATETPSLLTDVTAATKPGVPLVGRAREWKRMQAVWQVATASQPRLLVLSGEAGIGKTRLGEEMLRWANRQGIVTAVTHCYAAEGELAYAPIAAWLRADTVWSELKRLNREWLVEVGRLVPELLLEQPGIRQPDPMTEAWQRQRLFEALAQGVLVTGRPTLLLIDDLQWCTRDTLEWLHFLLRFDPQARLLIIGTVRIEEIDPDHPLTELLNALRRESRLIEISLDPLNPEETAKLAEHVMGRALTDTQVTHLFAETEGNPLFVVEMMRAELMPSTLGGESDSGPLSLEVPFTGEAELPRGVQAVLAHRLSQVTPSARPLLNAAAAIGRSFTFGVLARAARVDEDTVVRGLDELWQRRIVREHGPDAYNFTHDKLRAVAYAGLSKARQRILHRRVAEALEAEYASDLEAVSGQIAAHFEQAGSPTQAVSYYQRAAAFARHLYANSAAISYLHRALALAGEPPKLEATSLYDQLGEILHLLGRYDEAREAWQHALSVTSAQDRVTTAHLYRKLGNGWRDQYHYEEALRTYDSAEAALGNGDETDEALWLCRVQIELERITTQYWLRHVTEMLRLIDQFQPIIGRYGSMAQRARLHQVTALALLQRDRFNASRATVEHARAYLRAILEAGDTNALPAARFQLGFVLLWANDLTAAEEQIVSALTMAERSGDSSLVGRCLTYLTVIARKQGHLELVQERAERSLRVASVAQMPEYIGAAHGNLAWVAWRADDLTVARSHSREALDAWQHLRAGYMFEWVCRWPMIGLALVEGDVAAASAQAQLLLDDSQQRPPSTLESLLRAAIDAEKASDLASSRANLDAAVRVAREQGYL